MHYGTVPLLTCEFPCSGNIYYVSHMATFVLKYYNDQGNTHLMT